MSSDELSNQLAASGAGAVLIILPSQELEGSRATATSTALCLRYNPDGSCAQTFAVGGAAERPAVWRGFSARLLDGESGAVIWTASIDARPERSATGWPSLSDLAASAAKQIYAQMVEDGVVVGP